MLKTCVFAGLTSAALGSVRPCLCGSQTAINQGVEVDLGSGLKLEEALYAQLLPTQGQA